MLTGAPAGGSSSGSDNPQLTQMFYSLTATYQSMGMPPQLAAASAMSQLQNSHDGLALARNGAFPPPVPGASAPGGPIPAGHGVGVHGGMHSPAAGMVSAYAASGPPTLAEAPPPPWAVMSQGLAPYYSPNASAMTAMPNVSVPGSLAGGAHGRMVGLAGPDMTAPLAVPGGMDARGAGGMDGRSGGVGMVPAVGYNKSHSNSGARLSHGNRNGHGHGNEGEPPAKRPAVDVHAAVVGVAGAPGGRLHGPILSAWAPKHVLVTRAFAVNLELDPDYPYLSDLCVSGFCQGGGPFSMTNSRHAVLILTSREDSNRTYFLQVSTQCVMVVVVKRL